MGERRLDDGLRLLVSGTLLFLAHGQEEDGTKLSVMLGDHLLTNHTSPSGTAEQRSIVVNSLNLEILSDSKGIIVLYGMMDRSILDGGYRLNQSAAYNFPFNLCSNIGVFLVYRSFLISKSM